MEDNLYPRPDSSSAVTPLRRPGLLPAAVIALGAVYGSLGTSPLYTIKTCFHGSHGVPLTGGNVLGIVSLIFWSLLLVVGLKYLVFILRADNQGRGGIIALLALVARPEAPNSPPRRAWLLLLGLFAAALLSVSTGSKVKPKVLRAIVERLSAHPVETEALLPLLRISLRSVRASERREALSALARAALARPELRALITREIPELSLGPEESVCR